MNNPDQYEDIYGFMLETFYLYMHCIEDKLCRVFNTTVPADTKVKWKEHETEDKIVIDLDNYPRRFEIEISAAGFYGREFLEDELVGDGEIDFLIEAKLGYYGEVLEQFGKTLLEVSSRREDARRETLLRSA